MKKILLASTALVCAGLLSAPAFADQGNDTLSHEKAPAGVKLELSGEYSAAAGFMDSDVPSSREYGLKHDTEVHFSGETTLENGLTVGAMIDAEIAQSTDSAGNTTNENVTVDERFVYFAGSFGEVRAGSDDDARRQLSVNAPEPTKTLSVGDGDISFKDFRALVTAGAGATAGTGNGNFTGENDTVEEVDGDAAKLIYFTPSFNGLTLGASFAPDQNGTGDAGSSSLDTDVAPGDVFSIGGLYEGQIRNVGIAFSAGYTVNDQGQQGNDGLTRSGDESDEEATALGLNLTFANWTVGGSMGFFEDVDGYSNDDANVYDLGVMYETGPYAVGASYSFGDYEEGSAGGNEYELTTWQVSGTYALGQGIDLIGAYQYNDVETSASGTPDDQTGAFVVGTDITF